MQSSSATRGEPTAQPQRSASCVRGTPDLQSHLNEVRASKDSRTTLERGWERRHQANDEHVPSGLTMGNGTTSDDDIGPYGAGSRAFTANLRRINWSTKFRPNLPEKYDGTIDPEKFLQIYTTAIQAAGGGP